MAHTEYGYVHDDELCVCDIVEDDPIVHGNGIKGCFYPRVPYIDTVPDVNGHTYKQVSRLVGDWKGL